MNERHRLETALRKARLEWRRTFDSPTATSADRRRALVEWKTARSKLDFALVAWKRAIANRRKALADRRKARADSDWAKANPERRTRARRP
jgi:hypothetical protein